jgi:uncharacterized membrane protein YkoI
MIAPAPNSPWRRLALAALLCGSGAVVWASDDDHEQARAALQSGAVLPLQQLLERVAREQPGQVLELELERDHERWIYELKLLRPGGEVVKLKVDARSGAVLRQKAVR